MENGPFVKMGILWYSIAMLVYQRVHPPSKIKIPTGTPHDSMMIFPFRDFYILLQLLGDRPQAIDPVIALISLWGGDLVHRIHPNTSLHKGPFICLHGGKMYPGSKNHRFLQVFFTSFTIFRKITVFIIIRKVHPPIFGKTPLPPIYPWKSKKWNVSNRTSYLSNSSSPPFFWAVNNSTSLKLNMESEKYGAPWKFGKSSEPNHHFWVPY